MAEDKTYYYIKLKSNFFDSEEIKILEGMDNGYKYSNILLKMYLKSIKRGGLLMVNERIPYDAKTISTVTGHNINDVEKALVLFNQLGLIETLSNGAIYILDIQNFIGQSTTEADRVRAYRKSIDEKKTNLSSGEKLAIPTHNKDSVQMYNKCTPEIEIEIEKELDPETDINNMFESLWATYPKKRGKASISAKKKKEIFNIGEDQMQRCIERYTKECKSLEYMKNGSTFFNSGYVDYLDDNYEPLPSVKCDRIDFTKI